MELLVLGVAMVAGLLTALVAAAARRRGSHARVLAGVLVALAIGYGLSMVDRVTSLPVLMLATAAYVLTYVLSDIRWGVRFAPAAAGEREREPAFVDGRGTSQV